VIADHGGDGSRVQLGDVGAGYGISAMRERAALLDGTVTADPTEDGFRVELVLPAEPR
jgi:signal transduction histidine kinase